ncbi:ADP-ribose 1''-phosphate phosphatase [Emydomyces testavorans]|uniref:ADP-ribose 1''-phosphate phosphatase n=1 Tax=Emydomyces testavorans TaxID=2070801 RepID=A0AAF0DAZ2_9EURO|nr:ADP-ribose 1''-phosphate phosphatase [Emydomyces testavorans]
MNNILELEGNLFDAPENAALIHACNCQGTWGKGIAETFRAKYPGAYRIYRAHCQKYLQQQSKTSGRPIDSTAQGTEGSREGSKRVLRSPEGTALLIPPQPEDYYVLLQEETDTATEPRGKKRRRVNKCGGKQLAGKRHWIVCLFTSWHYSSKQKSSPEVILENTTLALEDLKRQLQDLEMTATDESRKPKETPTDLWSCRFNAGLFGVPWQETKAVLEEAGLRVTVVRPVGECL